MFNKISDRIYIQPPEHYTDRPNIGLIKGERYTLMFDAGNSGANVAELKNRLESQGLPQPDFLVVSHWHWDHTFGMHRWSAVTIAGKETNSQLQKMAQWKWDDESMAKRLETGEDIVFCDEMIKREYQDRNLIKVVPADMEFDGSMIIDLGGVTCHLVHIRGPHSSDAIGCYIPEEKFIFLGDSNGKDLYGKPWHFDIEHEEDFMDETAKIPYDDDLVKEYLSVLDTFDFDRCIGGHADIMTKEELYSIFR
ncbi:MAG: MBL fold metallo-hydrolase [Oscillospiraceae bacterium]|nr:MBL fold metallo-hydrolase [Oscillospiraceae bacterium]